MVNRAIPIFFLTAVVLLAHLAPLADAASVVAIRVPQAPGADCKGCRIATYQEAISAIACVFEKEFDLTVSGVYLLLYPHQNAFESSVANRTRFDPAYAQQTAGWAVALSTTDLILANEAALKPLPWPERVRVIAHELMHTVQYRLAEGRRSTSDQWLREGLAEWVSYRVVHSLCLGHFPQKLSLAASRVRQVNAHHPLPRLSLMVTFRGFAELRANLGNPFTYDHALLATDFLIEHHGLQSVIDYFRLFAQSDDRLENFRAAFGKDLSTFEEEFRRHVQAE